jgi:hypothetical protein
MATKAYIQGRQRFGDPGTGRGRPQAIIWSNNAGTISEGLYVPAGSEVGANPAGTPTNNLNQFLILSDHNRSAINFNTTRIEERKRTINGRMRSYHIADKLQISWSWTNLPSRAYSNFANFNSNGVANPQATDLRDNPLEYTVDGGAGGVELLDWYEKHKGPFWMLLAYDNYKNFPDNDQQFDRLGIYNEIVEVYFSDFNYSVVKRGGNNHDLWNVSVSLEQV